MLTEFAKKIILFTAICFLFTQGTAGALEVVYPKKSPATIYANSTFFIGNTKPKSKLIINGTPVKVWRDGSFVKVVQLKNGKNYFKLKSTLNNRTDKLRFLIYKKPKINYSSKKQRYILLKKQDYL